MIRLILPLILLTGPFATTHAYTHANAEIQASMQAVAENDCEFSSNGSLHSAETSAEHLELKYFRGKRHADSAEEFNERLASKSSRSGKPYQMVGDGETQPPGDWLILRLKELLSR